MGSSNRNTRALRATARRSRCACWVSSEQFLPAVIPEGPDPSASITAASAAPSIVDCCRSPRGPTMDLLGSREIVESWRLLVHHRHGLPFITGDHERPRMSAYRALTFFASDHAPSFDLPGAVRAAIAKISPAAGRDSSPAAPPLHKVW